MKILLSLMLVLAACSFKKTPLENQTHSGHVELYSIPEAPELLGLEKNEKRIIIASTNDMHANYNPSPISFKDSHNEGSQSIRIGGRDIIANYFKILRDTYKNVVLVDSGNIFSNASEIKATKKFYRDEGYDAITVGLRDFNLKVPAKIGNNADLFQRFAKNSKVPLVLSNLYGLKTGRVVEWKGTQSHILKDLKGVKVGIIGLVPDDISAQTPINNRVGFFVEDMLQATLRHARILRTLGADIIVVLTHQGIDCASELSSQTKLPPKKVNFDPKKESVCDLKSGLGKYLKRLPPQLVDVVIGGRIDQKMVNYVNGTLVMGGFADGKSFNYAEMVVNTKTRKIVPEKVVVHQPVMFCNVFFKETKDCFHEDPSIDHKQKIPATFLGRPIGSDEIISEPSDERSVASPPDLKDISRAISAFNADLSYIPQNSGETQLFIMAIPGKELARILEEDYNQNRKQNWWPSPFILNNQELNLSISGMEFDQEKIYRVLTDLESMQKNSQLTKHMARFDSEALMNYSWNSLEEDSVSSALAAQAR
jgi:hypothetical protein